MYDDYSIHSIGQILSSLDPATQLAISIVLFFSFVAALTVYLPLILRLLMLSRLEHKLHKHADGLTPTAAHALLVDFKALLVASPIQSTYEEFERRWSASQISEKIDRAPVRLMDILDERPLFPYGPRRSLLPAVPGLLLAVGALAALSGMIPSFSEAGTDSIAIDSDSAWMAKQIGLAIHAVSLGFICAIGASITGRWIEGAFGARSHGLDRVVESAFSSISPGELAEITRRTQQDSIETLGQNLTRFAKELNQHLDRGLQRIEQSTARSASLVTQEQRGALHTLVGEISHSVRQGVEHHLGELRGALQRTVEHQDTVAGSLAETFQSLVENSKTQDRVARTLDASARSVEDAARAMKGQATEMHPVLEHLGVTSAALSKTADRIGDTQTVVARTAEGVRGALESAASGVDDQRQFIELTLTEIRQAMVGLGDGLGESLKRSLREVDEVLSKSVGAFKDTLAESNETIDRLSSPIRATEGASREIHLALDRVRGEIEVLAQWMSQASKPLRSGLSDVDGRVEEIGRTMIEFNNHARQIDKTMEALRHEIHEESRRVQGVGSELGRRLQQTSDAVGLLESTTADAARHSRSDNGEAPLSSKFPRIPADRFPQEPATKNEVADHATKPDSLDEESKFATSVTPARDFTGSGFRVGASKAQGPDPYQRFDQADESAPSPRHSPTTEQELSPNLKLSGLLSPRGRNDVNANSQDNSQDNPKATTSGDSSGRTGGARKRAAAPDEDRDA